MFCVHCGTQMITGQAHCQNCGQAAGVPTTIQITREKPGFSVVRVLGMMFILLVGVPLTLVSWPAGMTAIGIGALLVATGR